MTGAHYRLLVHGDLPEHRKRRLIDKPFAVRDSAGRVLQARAFGFKHLTPDVEVGTAKYSGMTWLEVSAAVERGAVPELARLQRMRP
jgi:hypothetical protein